MSDKNKELTKLQRKIRKLKRSPRLFFLDSKGYVEARKSARFAWAKLGSFIFVLLLSIVVVTYYLGIASPRYISQFKVLVDQPERANSVGFGVIGLGEVSSVKRDTLVLKHFIESRVLAESLNRKESLKSHYEDTRWDWWSRLSEESSVEEFENYYKEHIKVSHDEVSDVLTIEVQGFSRKFAQNTAIEMVVLSESFINQLGKKIVDAELKYAEELVNRLYAELSARKMELLKFQDRFKTYSPDSSTLALENTVNELENEKIKLEAELKELTLYMQNDSVEVKSKRIRIQAIKSQLDEERLRLTNGDSGSMNAMNSSFLDVKLKHELALELYKSSLLSLENVRNNSVKKLKHLLVIQSPTLAQEDTYPRRGYNILTWFVFLIVLYGVIKLAHSVVKEHSE